MFTKSVLKSLQLPAILTILGVVVLGFACTGSITHASMHDGGMGYVAVMQQCCNTNISGHVSLLRSAVSAAPREMRDSILLLMLGLAAYFAVRQLGSRSDLDDSRRSLICRTYTQNDPDLRLSNYLQLAFARGILNPKVH